MSFVYDKVSAYDLVTVVKELDKESVSLSDIHKELKKRGKNVNWWELKEKMTALTFEKVFKKKMWYKFKGKRGMYFRYSLVDKEEE